MSADPAVKTRVAFLRRTWQREMLNRRDLALDTSVKIGLVVLVTVLAVLYLAPLYWLFVTSIKVPDALYESVPSIFPNKVSLLSWRRIFDHPFVPRWFWNSLVVSTIATAGTLVVASVAGYVFAKMNFPLRRPLFWLILLTMMLPGQATLVPMYVLMLRLNWIDTYWPLIVPSFADAFAVFLMKQYIQTLPSSLISAARLDACSEFKIFWKIVLPLCKSGLAVLTIFTFVGHWNSFLWPLLMVRRTEMQTLQVGLASLRQNSFDMQFLMASAAFAALPTIIVFLIFQRYFLEGLNVGAMKG